MTTDSNFMVEIEKHIIFIMINDISVCKRYNIKKKFRNKILNQTSASEKDIVHYIILFLHFFPSTTIKFQKSFKLLELEFVLNHPYKNNL